ncbi:MULTISPECIES: TRAP transporter large permease subunit [Halomonadaceae]|uniref:TRAP transporter large permease subunit n=2 Tax=Vreelandella TaxID=3137766 RepID=A0A7Z0LSC1_9GAMM|nr:MULTISPECIES: TRAP transporter large permease subunit [Halomonas]AJY48961.1 TRAP C4-dicarboxylate transport system permease DctM subunit [Halomonas sp. KO116]NYS77593.1 TRAP transporter large permease subunit [Halomonas glaciei]|tara:strand:+ start:6821 stop:8125 length:1305 start_codon:yes stop_codon:yes gene_type:complete
MEWYISLGIALTLLMGLFALGVPIFVAFLTINVLGTIWLMGSAGFGMFANSVYSTVTSETLTTIVLFVLMGELLFRSGSIDVIFDALDTLMGRMKGRLYFFVIVLATLFGALSGSALAVTAMLSRSALPTMQQRGYDDRLSIGLILGGASLAPIIPPSLLVIIIGSMVDISIARLLIAGIIPGILLAGLFVGYVMLKLMLNPSLAPAADESGGGTWRARGKALLDMAPFSIIIFSVLGLIMLGVATPSESAATGVLGAMLVAVYYRRFTLDMAKQAILSSLGISAMIIAILACSKLFSQLLSFAGATSGLVGLATSLELDPAWMLLLLMLVPFFACMFIDQIAFMMVVIPIYAPLVKLYGFDPIWFWTLFLINISVGSLTPPFGYNLFAIKGGAPSVPMQTIFAAAWPIVICFLFGMLVLFFLPSLITFLPSLI